MPATDALLIKRVAFPDSVVDGIVSGCAFWHDSLRCCGRNAHCDEFGIKALGSEWFAAFLYLPEVLYLVILSGFSSQGLDGSALITSFRRARLCAQS